jgi:hypothetical protein
MTPAKLVLGAIAAQALAGLVLGLPGHLSSDAIVQLYEARTLHFISFQPPLMSLLLRLLDAWMPGTALFVMLDQALLTASFILLLREHTHELNRRSAAVAVIIVLSPLLLAYTGIVWKDVLMSHLAAFGYVCLYVAARRPPGRRRIWWALAAVLALALAAALRQHALLLAIPGVVYAGFQLVDRARAQVGVAIVLCVVVIGVNVAIIASADESRVGPTIPRAETGLRSLAYFDFAGIEANGGVVSDAVAAAQLETTIVPFYSPLRNDTMPAPASDSALARMETPELLTLWRRSIMNSPRAYLSHRSAYFWALLWKSGTESRCTPVFTGVVPAVYVPPLGRDIMPELGLQARSNLRDRRLAFWHSRLMETRLFNHVFSMLVLCASAILLWRRGGATALVVFAASAVVFTLAYGVIGISCEFRYIYILPVAATLLLFTLTLFSSEAGERGQPSGSTARQPAPKERG